MNKLIYVSEDYRNLKKTLSLAMFFSIRILFANLHMYILHSQRMRTIFLAWD